MTSDAPKLLSVTEAAQQLGVSRSWLDRRRVSGDGPIYMRVGGYCRYDPRDLERWLASRRRTSTSQILQAEGAR